MRIYCVRHGESSSNAQTEDKILSFKDGDQLTEKGRQQAEVLGKRLAHEGISRIVTSTYQRAQETAHEIGRVLDLPIETNPDIHEVRESEEYYRSDPKGRKNLHYRAVMEKYSDQPGYSQGGADSFSDLTGRAKRFAEFLKRHSADDSLLVVSHNGFLQFFLGYVLFGESFSGKHLKVLNHFYMSNTGISGREYREHFVSERNNMDYSGWTVHTWNDEAHL